MHFIFISSLVPVAAPASGYDIANRVIVDAVRLLGHKVSVIGFLQPGQTAAAPDDTRLLGTLEVTNARVGKMQKALWLKDAFVHGEPVSVAKMHAVTASDIRAALGGFEAIDGLILNSVQLPGAFLDVFKEWSSLFVAHNVEARTAADNADLAGTAVSRWLYRRDAHLLRLLEQDLCAQARHVFTLAEADRAELGVASAERSTALPLVTSVTPPEAPSPRPSEFDVGLIGSWSWTANRTGLDWFLAEVAPRLPNDVKIAVAGGLGANTPAAPANVTFLGRVPDARAFVRSCRLVPLVSQTGTGVQLKTIETFEMGLPAVATQSALRGISDRPDNCVAADDPAAFAEAMTRLIGRSRSGENLDSDGRIFHAQQLSKLTQCLNRAFQKWENHG